VIEYEFNVVVASQPGIHCVFINCGAGAWEMGVFCTEEEANTEADRIRRAMWRAK
jgi:hypothetical protein